RIQRAVQQARMVFRRMQRRKTLVNDSAVIEVGAEFTALLVPRDDDGIPVPLGLTGEPLVGCRRVSGMEPAAATEIAGNVLARHEVLDPLERGAPLGADPPGEVDTVAAGKPGQARLDAGADLAA